MIPNQEKVLQLCIHCTCIWTVRILTCPLSTISSYMVPVMRDHLYKNPELDKSGPIKPHLIIRSLPNPPKAASRFVICCTPAVLGASENSSHRGASADSTSTPVDTCGFSPFACARKMIYMPSGRFIRLCFGTRAHMWFLSFCMCKESFRLYSRDAASFRAL